MRRSRPQDRLLTENRGFVLIIVLIVVAVLSLAAYSFTQMMLAHNETTIISGRQVQAQLLAASGVESVRAFLMLDAATQAEAGGIYHNSASFQAVQVLVSEDPNDQGRFTILAPALDEEGNLAGTRYGLEDESGRVNVNALLKIDEAATAAGMENAGRDLLMALPGMTEDVADAILDWMDSDDELRDFGAEYGDYMEYAPKNGPLETVEELLLVRGVTPDLLFGFDVNRNGMIDPSEMENAGDITGMMARGWSAYLTLFSQENNVNSLGEPRIDLNTEDMQALHDSLSLVFPDDSWVKFIVAYRQNGAYTEGDAGEPYSGGELDLSQPGKEETQLKQVLDLIGAKVQVQFQGEQQPTVLQSPFADDLVSMGTYMTTLMDHVTIAGETIPGRVNINQAPLEILIGLPGISEEIVQQILALRSMDPSVDDPNRQHETWLLTEGIVTLDEMKTLMPVICAGGDVYRTQVVGYYDDGQVSARLEVVLDATQVPPRVLLWRDISHLGRGYAMETLGAALAPTAVQ
ncbi:MAG: general secretion pathway protein GspK [Pirellulaceae bacterium]|nr:general secretion pathway protein GspK [Pirellulaceae bacterium]